MKKNIFKISSEQSGGMAKDKLSQMHKEIGEILSQIDSIKVDPWVFEHITTAHDDVSEIASYIRQHQS